MVGAGARRGREACGNGATRREGAQGRELSLALVCGGRAMSAHVLRGLAHAEDRIVAEGQLDRLCGGGHERHG